MKCPFCQQELEICGMYIDGTSKIWCSKCKLFGDSRLFEKLIRTRKALETAKDTLCWYDNNYDSVVARNTLDEIKTTLEQKDK